MDSVTANNPTPDNQATPPAVTVTDVAPNSQVINIPAPVVTPAPADTVEPKAPKQHPDITSRQTAGAIAYYSQPENREVFDHLVGEVNKAYGNSGLDDGQYVPRKQYEIDKAVAHYRLDDASAELLNRVDVGVIHELAKRLAAANAPPADTVNPTQDPTQPKPKAAKLPTPPASGKIADTPGVDFSAKLQEFRAFTGQGL